MFVYGQRYDERLCVCVYVCMCVCVRWRACAPKTHHTPKHTTPQNTPHIPKCRAVCRKGPHVILPHRQPLQQPIQTLLPQKHNTPCMLLCNGIMQGPRPPRHRCRGHPDEGAPRTPRAAGGRRGPFGVFGWGCGCSPRGGGGVGRWPDAQRGRVMGGGLFIRLAVFLT